MKRTYSHSLDLTYPASPSSQSSQKHRRSTPYQRLRLMVDESADFIQVIENSLLPPPLTEISPTILPHHIQSDGIVLTHPAFAVSVRKNHRRAQQDAYCVASDASSSSFQNYFGVFDGHGSDGDIISNHCADLMPLQFYHALNDGSSPIAALETAFANMEEDLKHKAFRGGSTALTCYIHPLSDKPKGVEIALAQCGDSKALLVDTNTDCSSDTCTISLAFDHTAANPLEVDRIEKSGGILINTHAKSALRVNGILNVTRSLGDFQLKPHVSCYPESRTHTVDNVEGQILILATDGLFRYVPSGTIASILTELKNSNNLTPSNISERLCEEALKNEGRDNVCVLAIDLAEFLKRSDNMEHPCVSSHVTKSLGLKSLSLPMVPCSLSTLSTTPPSLTTFELDTSLVSTPSSFDARPASPANYIAPPLTMRHGRSPFS